MLLTCRTTRFLTISLAIAGYSNGCAIHRVDDSIDPSIPVVAAPSTPNTSSVTWVQDGLRWGLQDKDGKVILPATYDDARPFSEGLAAVNRGAAISGVPSGGEWGYVDETGELVIPVTYKEAGSFSEGVAHVSNGPTSEETMFIDQRGEIQIHIPEAIVGDFREGLAPVYRDIPYGGQDRRTDFIDHNGDTVFSVGGYAEEFYDGLAVLAVQGGTAESTSNTSFGFIDKTGNVVIETRFGEASHFNDGLAPVRTAWTTGIRGMGDSWGYIDKTGSYVIEPIFNEAHVFHDGKAMVHQGGEFQKVYDGPCFWEGGTWWLIDREGARIGRIPDSSARAVRNRE